MCIHHAVATFGKILVTFFSHCSYHHTSESLFDLNHLKETSLTVSDRLQQCAAVELRGEMLRNKGIKKHTHTHTHTHKKHLLDCCSGGVRSNYDLIWVKLRVSQESRQLFRCQAIIASSYSTSEKELNLTAAHTRTHTHTHTHTHTRLHHIKLTQQP